MSLNSTDPKTHRRLVPKLARCLTVLSALPFFTFSAFSQESDDSAYDLFRSGTMDMRTLTEVLPMLADSERRPHIRAAIVDADEPPLADLVALLDFPTLAVRLGALELLEEMAGGDFSYNPWLPAESPENLAPLTRWKAWVGEEKGETAKGSIFSDDQRRGYLRDLMGEDADKASRARRMLEAEGMSAIGFLETFLSENAALPPGSRARVREAQYQIALTRQLGDQASLVARQLAFGSRDQLLSALSTVRGAGLFAIPILSDFINHPDSLVRETAIDSLLVSAAQDAVPIIAPILAAEQDVNVIHGALRRLKDIRGEETSKLVAGFLTHPDEDLLVSAIQTSLTLSGSDERFSSGGNTRKSSDADTAVLACLKDPRWRVRAVALEYVAKRKLTAAKNEALALIDDPDSFVRFAAIGACVALGTKEALPKLKEMILADAENAAAVIEGYAEMGSRPDEEILSKIDTYPPEARMAVIRAAYSKSSLAPLLLRYVNDPDLDVSCAALRAIASDDDRLKDSKFSSVIVHALRENKPEKTAAILERLDLPSNRSSNYRTQAMLEMLRGSSSRPDGPTALDPLYDAFAEPEGTASALTPAQPKIDDAVGEIVKELARLCEPAIPAALRLNAALHLAKLGDPKGITTIRSDLTSLTTAQKINVCEVLGSVQNDETADFLKSLLSDPVSEVRSAATECALEDQNSTKMARMVLDELSREGALLQPEEAYGYRFEYAARENSAAFRPWCQKVLDDSASPLPHVILACIAARHGANSATLEALKKHTASDAPLIRRAAWHSLLTARPAEISTHAKAIADDPEAFVREVLPNRITRSNYTWYHRFSDSREIRDNHYDHGSQKIRIDAAARAVLERMFEADPSPLVRFESGFALLQQGGNIDLNAFVQLLPKLSKETNASSRISSWLQENAARATPALRPLLAVIDTSRINADKMRILKARINPVEGNKGLLTFASLAAMDGDDSQADGPLLTGGDAAEQPERTSLDVIYFFKPGCAECTRAQEFIRALKTDFPLLTITEHNINLSDGLVLNQSLCAWFDAPSTRYAVAPAVFTQGGFVIGPDISPATLGTLFARTMKEPQDDAWKLVTDTRLAEAVVEVEKHYEKNITLPVVLIGGLLDGINPCAFATIIFFLSYLQIARRSPREMLMVGAAFISAVFLAYLAAGLLLYQVLETLTARIAGVQKWMNIVFGCLALVAAWLSLRDALRARAGRMGEMTLQLPGMLKDRIRGVIRTGARARRFVIAAFLSGIVISFLELACTGQVYAPIIYQIQKGKLDAVLWLVMYNLAFITPLVVIFLLAYGGLRSETLVAFQRNNTFAVKIALALLFLTLALLIFFGDIFLGS
jgi:HEAT repeat protein/cytochrome c biogenesis protein CcdA/glutaredoxin-related protein